MKFTAEKKGVIAEQPAPIVRAFEAQVQLTNEPADGTTRGWVSVSSDAGIKSMVRSSSLAAVGYERVCTPTPDDPSPRQPACVILSHEQGAILGDWVRDGIVLRDGHGGDQCGRLMPAYVRGGKLGGDEIIWSVSERAQVLMRDFKSGVRRNISVEGDWNDADLELLGENDGIPVIRAARWVPLAAAIVDVPADPTVGVARSLDTAETKTIVTETPHIVARKNQMNEQEIAARDAARANDNIEIFALARDYGVPQEQVSEHIKKGTSLSDFRGIVLRDFAAAKAQADAARTVEKANVARKVEGVSDTIPAEKLANFSFLRAIRGMAKSINPDYDVPKEDYGFEREVSQEAVRLIRANPEGKNYVPRGMCIPWDLVRGGSRGVVNREFNIAGTGSNIVAQNLRPEMFIDYLRSKLILSKLGVTTLTGLVGDVLIPKQTASAAGAWIDETTGGNASTMSVGQIKVTPHTIGAYTDLSRQLLLQSTPSADMLVMNDLVESLARTLQVGAFHGTGANNQPVGLFTALASGYQTYAAITETTVASDGNPTYVEVQSMKAGLAKANVDGPYKFAMAPGGFYGLTTTSRSSSGYPIFVASEDGEALRVADQQAEITTGINSKSGAVGRWDSMVLAMWGALDLTLDPYSLSTRGGLRVISLQSADFGYRYLPAFAWSSKFAA